MKNGVWAAICANITARSPIPARATWSRRSKNIRIHPRIHIEEGANGVHFAVNCRHCADPLCVKGCITGALTRQNGMIVIDENKCVGCFTCILSCPYGAIEPDETGHVMQKCELCTKNGAGEPLCVKNCPNQAIVYEER